MKINQLSNRPIRLCERPAAPDTDFPWAGCKWSVFYFVSELQNVPNRKLMTQICLCKWSWKFKEGSYVFSHPTLLSGTVTHWTILNLGHCCFLFNGTLLFRKAKQRKFGKINLLEACKCFCLQFHYLPDIYWFP